MIVEHVCMVCACMLWMLCNVMYVRMYVVYDM